MATFRMGNMDDWVKISKARQEAVMRKSMERVGFLVNVDKSKGGRMPVKNRNLRGSFKAGINGVMRTEGEPELHLVGTIKAGKIGDTFNFGWGVESKGYAKRMNWGFVGFDSLGREYNQAGNFFLELAEENWQRIVNEEATEARRRTTF